MPAIEPTAAIVLAGGRGTRLAMEKPKALVSLGDSTLLERAVATADAVAQEVIVVAPPELSLPRVGARRVNDPPDGGGPFGGVLAGMRSITNAAPAVIVLGVDFPLVRAETLQWLRASLGSGRAVVPAPHGTWQPLAAVYALEVLGAFERQWNAGERSIMRAVRELDPKVMNDSRLAQSTRGAREFLNVNTQQDLADAARLLAGAAFDS